MNKEIKAVEIINFKKVSEYLTGKSFNIRSDRDFGKHKSNIDELIEAIEYWMSDIVEEVEKPKRKIDSEKKSNPTDDNVKAAWSEYDSKVNSKKESSINDEARQFVKPKVDMDALRKISAGEGVKGTFSSAKKKVNIDEEYEFEYVKSIPDQDDQIQVDKKGLAFYSKYDLGVFYVKWEGKYLRFDSEAEFDRFSKEYLTF